MPAPHILIHTSNTTSYPEKKKASFARHVTHDSHKTFIASINIIYQFNRMKLAAFVL